MNYLKFQGWTQNQWKEYIIKEIRNNDLALKKAILLVYQNQTTEEKIQNESIERNNLGFNKWDGPYLTGIAKKILKGKNLTPKDLAICRNKISHYWKQIMNKSLKNIEEEKRFEEELKFIYYSELEKEQMKNQILPMPIQGEFNICNDCHNCSYGICDECYI